LLYHPKQKPRRGGGLRQINNETPTAKSFYRSIFLDTDIWRCFLSCSLIFLRQKLSAFSSIIPSATCGEKPRNLDQRSGSLETYESTIFINNKYQLSLPGAGMYLCVYETMLKRVQNQIRMGMSKSEQCINYVIFSVVYKQNRFCTSKFSRLGAVKDGQ
jgi:hypothetical protein